ncbi:MAG: FHA domain-containing protein, partial [Myxococcota bacterium]
PCPELAPVLDDVEAVVVRRGGIGEPVEVGPLPPDTARRALQRHLPLGPQFTDELVERSWGRIGLAVRWLRALARDDVLSADDAGWWTPGGAWTTPDVAPPPLDAHTREAVALASLLGVHATDARWALLGAPADLETLRARGWLDPATAAAVRDRATAAQRRRAASVLVEPRVDITRRRAQLLAESGHPSAAADAFEAAWRGAMEAGATYAEVLSLADALQEQLGHAGQAGTARSHRVRTSQLMCRLRSGDPSGADAAAAAFLESGPPPAIRTRALEVRAYAAGFDARVHDALALLDRIPVADRATPRHASLRGWLLDAIDGFDAIEALCDAWPDSFEMRRHRAFLDIRRGRADTALTRLHGLLSDAQGADRGACLHDLAWAQWHLGAREEALTTMSQAVEAAPGVLDRLVPQAEHAAMAVLLDRPEIAHGRDGRAAGAGPGLAVSRVARRGGVVGQCDQSGHRTRPRRHRPGATTGPAAVPSRRGARGRVGARALRRTGPVKIEVLHDDDVVHAVPLDGGPVTLGRGPTNAVVLPDPGVSTHHALLAWEHGQLVVRDLQSTNGTHVGGQVVVGARPVSPGDEIRLGPTARIRIVEGTLPAVPAGLPQTERPTGEALPYRLILHDLAFRAELGDSTGQVTFRAANQVALLYRLAEADGDWVDEGTVATAVWGRALPLANNLNVLVHRVRKRAEEAGMSRWFIERRPGELRLRVAEVIRRQRP